MSEESIPLKLNVHAAYPQPPITSEFSLPITATVKDIHNKVKELTQNKYTEDMYELKFKLVIPMNDPDASLKAIGFQPGEKPNPVYVERAPKFKGDAYNNMFNLAAEVPTVGPSASVLSEMRNTASTTMSSAMTVYSSNAKSVDYWEGKSKTGFAGLANQGATCYLNSLIQSLFMTPEFRDSVFKWDFDTWARRVFEEKLAEQQKQLEEGATDTTSETDSSLSHEDRFQQWKEKTEVNSVPRQLQKLFARMLKSDKRAETTSSFGWDRGEAFTQHDVQELCRVLFEALENVWKGTEQSNLINELYEGEMKDFVQCLNCGHESARVDKFLDIPLVIKAFGSEKAVSSVEEALEKFVEVETLDGDNKYFCEPCKGKHDALKGLKFKSFPYLLALHLKRFDFDFVSMRRIKLHDRILDMNQFLETGAASLSQSIRRKKILQEHNLRASGEVETEDKETDNKDEGQGGEKDQEKEEPNSSASEAYRHKLEEALKNGPYVYELYAILVHRGTSMGGHYYAYIKPFSSGKWHCFNDSSVSLATKNELEEAYGGSSSKTFQSGASAYMLMYRQYDPMKNIVDCSADEIPETLRNIFEEEEKKEKQEQEEKKRKQALYTYKVYHAGKIAEFEVHEDKTLQTVLDDVVKQFSLEEELSKGCLRLRDYQPHNCIPQKPYTEVHLSQTLVQLAGPRNRTLTFEIKKETEEWEPWVPSDTYLRVSVMDEESSLWSPFVALNVSRDCTLGGLKKKLEDKFGVPAERQILVKEDIMKEKGYQLTDNNALLRIERIYDGTKLWMEPKTEYDETPRAYQEVQRIRNEIEVLFTHPEDPKRVVNVLASKLDTLLQLKESISKLVNLDLDSLVVYKETMNSKIELRDEAEILKSLNFYNSIKLVVEKGKPMRNGEINIKFSYFDANAEAHLRPLFALPLPGKLTVAEAKKAIVDHFNSLQENPETKEKDDLKFSDPTNLRLRDLRGIAPGKIFMDTELLKNVCQGFNFSGFHLLIQKLPEDEIEAKEKRDIIFFLQQFFPSTWSFGPRFEFTTNEDEKLTDFRDRMAFKTGIKSLAFVDGKTWEGPEVLSMPKLNWIIPTEGEEKPSGSQPSYLHNLKATVKSLWLKDGELVVFKDNEENFKELTEEEKTEMKRKEAKLRQAWHNARWPSSSRQETGLVIKTKDVAV